DGSRFWAGVSIAALRGANGEVTGFAKVTRDLTSRREAEQRERAHQDLERVSRAKDEFLATMSHELRTPLNAILGWVTMLSMDGGAKPRDDAKLARGLQVIERSARAQERLVSDLLDMSRIVNGKLRMSMQRVKLAAVLHAAADVLRQVAAAKGVRLVVELDPDLGELLADPDRLQQVIVNLLTNALRHTPRDGRVTVRGERCDGGVRIRVEDTGAGIAAEHLPFIFDRFRQVDGSTTRAHGGLGLGLAIVRHLVEAHGGSVVANSDGEGRGATFTITLPVRAFDPAELPAPRGGDGGAERAAGASETATTHANLLCGVRVLVVDDHADSREIIGLALEDAGATVTTAACAQEALDASGPFDVIVSDIGMPGMDGYSLMKTIRSRNSGADIPAIALTAFASATDAEYARRCGYQEHLAKPVDPRGLIESVKTWARVKGDHSTSTSPAT
ncbi:MAG TPA: ATP-binding protein, partial [Polyangiaceae bacterium]